MSQKKESHAEMEKVAEQIRVACIEAAKEGFNQASMQGLCTEGAIEAAVSAIQMIDLNKVIDAESAL